jgi:hypothetical protein
MKLRKQFKHSSEKGGFLEKKALLDPRSHLKVYNHHSAGFHALHGFSCQFHRLKKNRHLKWMHRNR